MQLFKASAAVIAGGAFALALPLCAQANAHPGRNAEVNANQRAVDFMNTINKDEVQAAKQVQGMTHNTRVKDFTDMIINDHSQNENQLQSLASRDNINLNESPALHQQDKQEVRQLQNEPANEANRNYVNAEVRDHRDAIRRLRTLETQVTDPGVKQYIQRTIPMMQRHLERAEALQKQFGQHLH